MFARLWWKEARQAWPVWGFLALAGIAVQSFLFVYLRDETGPGVYARVAMVVTMIYLFLVAAAVFAGERENGTLWILDAMAAGRLKVWSAKASFTLATTLALGLVLWLGVLGFGRFSWEWPEAALTALVWWLTALGWGLLWSAILPNAVQSAVLAMASFSLTLLLRVNLQNGPTLEAAPLLLGMAALTTGASAWFFRSDGPPRREPRWARPTSADAVVEPSGEVEKIRRPRRIWTASVPRLFWQTLRQARTRSWTLVVLAVAAAVAPYVILHDDNYRSQGFVFTLVGAAILSLATGVSAFNDENRKGTHRFLLHHGARAGVVWIVKVATWWAVSFALWGIALIPVWSLLPSDPLVGPDGVIELGSSIGRGVWGLTIPFAIAVVSGMVFRRGIMALTIAVVASLAVVIPMGALFAAQVLFPWHWPFVAVGLLAVSWAWRGDWLRAAPGWRRWARLAFFAAAAPAVLVPLYIADRVLGVTELPPKLAEGLFFRRSQVVEPVAEEDNAAPLYKEAYRLYPRAPYPTPDPAKFSIDRPIWMADLRYLDRTSFDPRPDDDHHQAEATIWLKLLEPALAKLREGSRKPAVRYIDLRTATDYDRTEEPPIHGLVLPLAVSARVRLARGDLDGAWDEIEALARLARQYSYTSQWSTLVAEPVANGLALRWAADPRQTAATLEKAVRSWRAIPPGASPAEWIRVEAALFQNLLDLPREKLIDAILHGGADLKRKIDVIEKLRIDVQTTPWEVARARRVYDLLAAAWIQRFNNNPLTFASNSGRTPSDRSRRFDSMVDPEWRFRILMHGGSISLSPEELNTLTFTTPLLRYASLGRMSTETGREQATRRAVLLALLLRLHQVRHDGKLPGTLDGLLARPDGDDDLGATPEDLVDPCSGKPFGYVRSNGRTLLPIGAIETPHLSLMERPDSRLRTTEGSLLLYSVGPDGVDDRAERNVGYDRKGDLVFPLKDDVKPPAPKAP